MTDHTARPESWETVQQWADSVPACDCLMDLRARVERLEQAGQATGESFRVKALQRELERERLRLAVVGAVVMADTPESAARVRDVPQEFHSASMDDAIRMVDELMETRAKLQALEQAQQQPEPEPAGGQTLHTIALRMVDTLANLDVLPEITETIRRAIREPMQPAPSTPHAAIEALRDAISALRYIEQGHGRLHGVGWDRVFDAAAPFLAAEPAPSTPAGLVSVVAELIARFASSSRAGDDCTPAASEFLHKVADWLDSMGREFSAALLRDEVGR